MYLQSRWGNCVALGAYYTIWRLCSASEHISLRIIRQLWELKFWFGLWPLLARIHMYQEHYFGLCIPDKASRALLCFAGWWSAVLCQTPPSCKTLCGVFVSPNSRRKEARNINPPRTYARGNFQSNNTMRKCYAIPTRFAEYNYWKAFFLAHKTPNVHMGSVQLFEWSTAQ